jgi:hypothetical protein
MGKPKKAAVGPKAATAKRARPDRNPPADIVALAQQSQRETGVPASVTLGQWAWESGWGQHSPNNNPFGMKASKSQAGANLGTTEQGASGLVKTTGKFRSFDSLEDAFRAHGEYVKNRFPWAMDHTDNPDEFVAQLQSHPYPSYATDKDYVAHITGIMHQNHFEKYDQSLTTPNNDASLRIIDGEHSVVLGSAQRVAARVESPHSGGGKVIEGSQTVFVGTEQLQMAREDDATDDGYHVKTAVHSDILVG